MHIYLPIAEMSVSAEVLLMLGTLVGFLSGVFGVGGGFLTTPFLIFMGIPPAVAVGTQANQLIATSTTGVLGYWKQGNVDLKIAWFMLSGGFFGSIIGILIFKLLQYLGQIDLVISILYVFLLGIIGLMMLYESIGALFQSHKLRGDIESFSQSSFAKNLPYKVRFSQSRLHISAVLPVGIGVVSGLLISVMGIGGGFLIVPALIYILGMPALLVPGTSLFQIIFISAFSCILHAWANHTVDIVLAAMLMVGGVVGAHLGVRASRWIRGAPARISLALIIVCVSFRLAADLFVPPVDLYEVVVR